MYIGKIVGSTLHTDYACRVYGRGEAATVPAPGDYGFGTFLAIEGAGGGYLVGVVYNTTLLNPEFGALGPRLSPQEDLAVFSPDYLAEKATLVGITILGAVSADGGVSQGVPALAAEIDQRVRTMTSDEFASFHLADGRLQLAYLPLLLALRANPIIPPLVLRIIGDLKVRFPHESRRLAILESNLAWVSRVEPLG